MRPIHLPLLLPIMLGTLVFAKTPPEKVNKYETTGIEVKVTPEMTGAGMVSSGAALPAIPPVTGSKAKPVPSWGKPLPYPIMIADRRNNRLIEI